MTKDKLIEKQGNYIAYLQGVIRALRMMSGIEATGLNTEAEQKYESEIAALKQEPDKKLKEQIRCSNCRKLIGNCDASCFYKESQSDKEKTERQIIIEVLNCYKDNLGVIDSYKFNSVALDIINELSQYASQHKEQPEITDEEIDKWAFGRVENTLFDRGYLIGLKHGAIAMRDNKIK